MKIYVVTHCYYDYYEYNDNVFVTNTIPKCYKWAEQNGNKDFPIILGEKTDEEDNEFFKNETSHYTIEIWEV
jgi:hypothetical protein